MWVVLGSFLFVECINVFDVMGGKFLLDGSDLVFYEMICDFLIMICVRFFKFIVFFECWYGYLYVMFG